MNAAKKPERLNVGIERLEEIKTDASRLALIEAKALKQILFRQIQ